jgi:N-methylhydantoinase A
VTDANVFLGYIPEGPLADGQITVSRDRAERALERVAGPLGLSTTEAAAGIHAIANARMTRALRSVSSEKGRDPREFALIAYGGAGPVHAVGLAEDLGCRTVLIPALAGLFSSLGLLYARPEFHDVHTCHLDARGVDPQHLEGVFAALKERLGGVDFVRSAELRYGGQTWEIEVEAGDPVDLDSLIAAFEDEHERLYGVRGEQGAPIEIRALRLAGLGRSPAVDRLSLANGFTVRAATRETALGELPVRTRVSIGESAEPGPMLIDEYDTTVVVRSGWTVRRDAATETLILETTA